MEFIVDKTADEISHVREKLIILDVLFYHQLLCWLLFLVLYCINCGCVCCVTMETGIRLEFEIQFRLALD